MKLKLLILLTCVSFSSFSQDIDTTDIYYQSISKYVSFNKNGNSTYYFNYDYYLKQKIPSILNGHKIIFIDEQEQQNIIQNEGGLILYFINVNIINNEVVVYIGNHGILKKTNKKLVGGVVSFYYKYNCKKKIFVFYNYKDHWY